MKYFTPVLLLFLSIVVLCFAVIGNHGLLQLLQLESELTRFQAADHAFRREIRDLEKKIEEIETGDFSIEKKARDELGLGRPNEVIYLFSDQLKTNNTTDQNQRSSGAH